ncbi:MAG: DUF4198 domain-containing protein [Pseudomonadota bacterium]
MMARPMIALGIAVAIGHSANADTAYVKPSTFTPALDQTITVEVAFNDDCCEPRYPVRTANYRIIDSAGGTYRPDRVEAFATTTMLEHAIATSGTTRITTGERLGRKGEYVEIESRYYLVNSPDAQVRDIPEDTPILSSQTATVSDAYITVGAPDWGAIRQSVGRLAIEPTVHPDNAIMGSPYIGRVTFDDEPVANHVVILTNEMQRLNGQDEISIMTDDAGVFTIDFVHPGLHLIMIRMQAPAPDGAETDIRSYTTSLTLFAKRR